MRGCDVVESPVGDLVLLAGDEGLRGLYVRGAPPDGQTRVRLDAAREQLDAYFAGELTRFDLEVAGDGTPFQRRVWDALAGIPYGETRTYGEVAAQLGAPAACRAVGAANGRNPLSIVVPCHRLVGSDGSLTGYRGGLAAKRWLLEHERRNGGRN